jgi:hypothetical protein
MDGLTTAQELDAMRPDQRQAPFDASVVLDATTLTERQQELLRQQDDELRERYGRQAS